jgi:salicylate hydroxylase
MHLHSGLAEVARRHGAEIIVDARVQHIDWASNSSKQVLVTTTKGKNYRFDLLIGADGVRSAVRNAIMPRVKPRPPTGNCAYRAVVPYDKIREDVIASELIDKLTMEVWMAPKAYIISYPISGGKLFNMVLSHHLSDHLVDEVEDIDMEHDFRQTYKDFDPRIKRIVDMVDVARRWPLLVTGPLETWSTSEKNVVLMGYVNLVPASLKVCSQPCQ